LNTMYTCRPEPASHLAGPSILVVEDEILIAMGLEMLIAQFGFLPAGIADTPAKAYRLVEQARPDLAIVDIRLAGGTDGLDVIRRLSARGIPVIASSAHGSPVEAASAGALGMLAKPYTAGQLREMLERLLPGAECASGRAVGWLSRPEIEVSANAELFRE
jgi:CheY-like chemotaxis protein